LEVVAVGVSHCQHVETLIQLFLGQLVTVDEAEVDNSFANGDAFSQCVLSHLCCILVADCRVQWGHDGWGRLSEVLHTLSVWLNAVDQALSEDARGISQQTGRFENVACHHRDEDVELELALGTTEGNRSIVADNLCGNLSCGLTQNRVDLARHDGRTWLQIWKVNFSETSQWARAHQTDIVGDLVQGNSDDAHCAGELDQCVAVCLSLEVVLSLR